MAHPCSVCPVNDCDNCDWVDNPNDAQEVNYESQYKDWDTYLDDYDDYYDSWDNEELSCYDPAEKRDANGNIL